MELSITFNNEGVRPKLVGLDDSTNNYQLTTQDGTFVYLKLHLADNRFEVIEKSQGVNDSDDELQEKLDELALQLIESIQQGTENDQDDNQDFVNPYDPDTIRVETKSFSLRQIYDMIEAGDIDLTPDYQRNFVWDNYRKSRLIESILLRIPLPVFYFSQDEDGRINVVDGLQRLTTIVEFMNNKLRLRSLEYLHNCEGKFYKNDPGSDARRVIDSKYFRWFNMTQIIVNVIDPQSPSEVKYDIFRRINTGGKPLNSQEIRNCLASPSLRTILKEMAALPSFSVATLKSVKDTRMEAQELALRFIGFSRLYKKDPKLSSYSGNMESTLNNLVDELNKIKEDELRKYIPLYDNALQSSAHLFGQYAFRKCLLSHLELNAHRQLINKALFITCTVLLSEININEIIEKNEHGSFAIPLAKKITDNPEIFSMLTYSTNARANLVYAFDMMNNLIKQNIK